MDLTTHQSLLTTGARVPLLAAAMILGHLERLLDDTQSSRALVMKLRKACLTGEPAAAADIESFCQSGFSDEDGTLDPVVVEVVKAGLLGAGAGLHIVPPFVNPWDQAVATLVLGHIQVRAALPQPEADALIAAADSVAAGVAGHASGTPNSWQDAETRRRNGEVPPPSLN